MNILKTLETAKKEGKKLIAVLIDPDKTSVNDVQNICNRINKAPVDYILMGGSTVSINQTALITKEAKKHCTKPIILFPGDYTHLTNTADALFFLNLISGDNPEYLIHQQVKSIPFLEKSTLEVISTGYILIDGGTETSTMKVSKTTPIPQADIPHIGNTAKAGEFMGQKLIYLEAGSGANKPVEKEIIEQVSNSLNIPIIVGGGIKSSKAIKQAHNAGATLVVVGTAFEESNLFCL